MNLTVFLKLATRNVFRNRVRSAITIGAIAFGAISLILTGGFIEDTFRQMREAVIHSHLGHLQIYNKAFLKYKTIKPYKYLIKNSDVITKKLLDLPHVKLVTPRLEFFGLLSIGDVTVSVFCQGVEPKGEKVLSMVKGIKNSKTGVAIQEGQDLDSTDEFSVIIGKGLAKSIGAHVGDSIILLVNTVDGALNAYDFVVKGIFFTTTKEFDDRSIRLPISAAKKLIRTDGVQKLILLADETENTEIVASEVHHLIDTQGYPLEFKLWTELADFYNKTVKLYYRQFFVLKVIILIIVLLSIFNTINMSIIERTREIGTVMALGFKQREVMIQFILEGLLLGIIGGVCGIICGSLLAEIISYFGIPMPPPPGATGGWIATIKVVPSILVTAFSISVIAAILSAIYPAYKASRLEIAQALRYI